MVLSALLEILKAWWWVLPPIFLWPLFKDLWLWWRQEIFSSKLDPNVILEIVPPEEMTRPIKAMENVFANLWPFYEGRDFKEKWWDGKYQRSFSVEIVSLGGEIHFLLRVPKNLRSLAEASIYSQYPDAEVVEFKEYTKEVPANLPDNPDWDLWGASFRTIKDDVYPIRTYFEFESGESLPEEEQRIDPVSVLLEGLSNLKEGEQMWIQLVLKPVTNDENNYQDRAKKLVDKLFGRPEKKEEFKPILQEAAELLVVGPQEKEEKKEEPLIPFSALMRTPGETKIIEGIEKKVSKKMYECHMRFVFLGKKDVFFKPNVRIPFGYANQYTAENLNGLRPHKPTVTSVTFGFVKRRTQYRKRRIFRLYKDRLPPTWPLDPKQDGKDGVFILNTEELASLFHFPSRKVAPTPALPRIPVKRGEAPWSLPT